MGWGRGVWKSPIGVALVLVFVAIAMASPHGTPNLEPPRSPPSEPNAPPDDRAFAVEPIAPRPTMGWNSWNHFACDGLNEALARETADAMVASGLHAAGYDTVALDACWSAESRDGDGNLTNHPMKFPSGMKALGEYIHARGLRYGIYASIGTLMCGAVGPGSLNHEFRDVARFASWGVDYIKADRCSAEGQVMKDLYARWRDAILASGRPMILSASDNNPPDEPWAWGPVTAHQWRMSGDISDDWTNPPGQPSWMEGMINIFDRNALHAAATAPGTFNDPDMLQVGNGGMTDNEYRTHFGLWALMSAPLIAGNDVRNMRPEIRDILINPEVIAVDQDLLGFQAVKASDNGQGLQVWNKPIATPGGRVVGLLNRGTSAATMTVTWSAIGLAPGDATVRDLWARVDRGTFRDGYSVRVEGHGLALLRIVGTDRMASDGLLSAQPWTYMANEWGPAERNQSSGGPGAEDGRTLSLNGVQYPNGFGVSAPSALEFRLGGSCSAFTADVGIDDEVGSQGTVMFQVWGDGQKLYDSGHMTGSTATRHVSLMIPGVRSLRLQVIAVDATADDHADWTSPRVTCPTGTNQPPQARFTMSATLVKPGETVAFDATASTDPDGAIRAYEWHFGDGSTGQDATITHAYDETGAHTVRLVVEDDRGTHNETRGSVIVRTENAPPTILSATPEASPVLNLSEGRTFVVVASDPDGDSLTFTWTLDGLPVGNSSSFTFVGTKAGIQTLRVLVSDGAATVTYEWVVRVRGSSSGPLVPGSGWTYEFLAVIAISALVLIAAVAHGLRGRR